MNILFSILLAIGFTQLNPTSSRADEQYTNEQEQNDESNRSRPIRIFRTDLQKSLIGTIHLETQGQENEEPFEYETLLNWVEEPTQLSPPQEGALADFRDYQGCLQFQALAPLAVCFNVMPDVSSVGVNSREMVVRGVESFVSEKLNSKLNDLHLVQVTRGKDSVQITFSGTLEPKERVSFKFLIFV